MNKIYILCGCGDLKKQLKSKDILFPVPPALVVSGFGENANIITIAWVGIVGSSPPAIGISLHKDRYSLSLIRQTKQFSVNIPSCKDFKKVDYCGLVSGKNTDKFKDTGFSKADGIRIKVPIIKECPVNIECQVIREVEIMNWILIIGEILELNVDSDCLDENGKISISKVNPLAYIPTIREYWSVGEKLGDGFSAGKNIKNV